MPIPLYLQDKDGLFAEYRFDGSDVQRRWLLMDTMECSDTGNRRKASEREAERDNYIQFANDTGFLWTPDISGTVS